MRPGFRLRAALPFVLLAVSGCADLLNDNASSAARNASFGRAGNAADGLPDGRRIANQPMYDRRMLAVDLPTVIRVAMARNIDIQEAQQRIAASRGEFEANIGMIFPSLTPNITSLGIQGAVSTPAGLAVQAFNHVIPLAVIQWIINPGQVAYDVIASKRRLEASEQQDEAVLQETTRAAAAQYYDVVLAQAQVAAAQQAIKMPKNCSA